MASTPDRSVLVTGASSGIGYTAAQGLRARGYGVIASARKQEDVQRLSAEGFTAVQLDLANSASIRAAVETTLAHTGGRVYGLFNNGGFGQLGALEDITRDALRAQFEVNVFGAHELTRLILPVMRAEGRGRIIQNSSLLGLVALKYRGAYNASKFALEALSDTLRQELRGTGIRVVLIEPGPITSRFRENAYRTFERTVLCENPDTANRGGIERWLKNHGSAGWFTLPAEAVLAKVIRALEQDNPSPRYFVSTLTYAFAFLKRALPDRALDALMARIQA
ncbi:MAG: SDR family NAD(P)-dependent oxidoreductase [Pseudomonadota bacterium]|nr:SDR family NAD(P)-dependent oxidoreductase [Pseudomonadota bacterium]